MKVLDVAASTRRQLPFPFFFDQNRVVLAPTRQARGTLWPSSNNGHTRNVLQRHGLCSTVSMSVRDFRDLVAWQLADALRWEVIQFTSEGPAARDFRFRDDIRASAGSAPANIAEGFGRFRPRPFAQFLEYAKASLDETQDHLIEAKTRALIDAKLFSRLCNLPKAAERATTNLLLSKLRQAKEERKERHGASARPRPSRTKPGPIRRDK